MIVVGQSDDYDGLERFRDGYDSSLGPRKGMKNNRPDGFTGVGVQLNP